MSQFGFFKDLPRYWASACQGWDRRAGWQQGARVEVTTVTWAVDDDSLGWDDKGEEEGKTV